jgi:hypothetical protein
VLSLNAGVNSITIPPGSYSASTLAAEMVVQFTAEFALQTTTITFSPTTFKLTINKTSPFVVDSIIDEPTSTAAPILGFSVTSASGNTVTSDSAINISGPNYLLLTSTKLTDKMLHRTLYGDNTYKDVLWSLPVNTSPGNIITHQPNLPIRFSSKISIKTTDIIDFQLLDEDRNAIDLNGLEWSVQFLFLLE